MDVFEHHLLAAAIIIIFSVHRNNIIKFIFIFIMCLMLLFYDLHALDAHTHYMRIGRSTNFYRKLNTPSTSSLKKEKKNTEYRHFGDGRRVFVMSAMDICSRYFVDPSLHLRIFGCGILRPHAKIPF